MLERGGLPVRRSAEEAAEEGKPQVRRVLLLSIFLPVIHHRLSVDGLRPLAGCLVLQQSHYNVN